MKYLTIDTNGKQKAVDLTASDNEIGNRTANPATAVAYGLTGSITQWLSWIVKRFEEATGVTWGVTIPFSLKSLWELPESKTAMIPVGFLYVNYRAVKNETINYLYIDCVDVNGALQNPTSFVITVYGGSNGSTLLYTSPAITTATTTATVSLTINDGDLIRVLTSNTTGITGSISVSPRRVNR